MRFVFGGSGGECPKSEGLRFGLVARFTGCHEELAISFGLGLAHLVPLMKISGPTFALLGYQFDQ